MRRFEFDPAKDETNGVKHGLSLAEASEMDWARAVVLADNRLDYGEPRLRGYAMLKGRLHMAAFTVRGASFRIISLRRASRQEIRRHGRAAQS